MTEEVATFGDRQSLVGILTDPPLSTLHKRTPGIVILGAGMVHRVGPNRLSVKIARLLGHLGFTTLRFDFSGIGDSSVRKDHLPYSKSVILEIQEAMDFVQSSRGIQSFILLGICTGAAHSFEAAKRDPRIRGVVLINPAGGFDRTARDELAEYFRNCKKVKSMNKKQYLIPKNWWRAITGQVDYKNLKRILSFQGKRLLLGQKRLLPNTEKAFGVLYNLNQQGVNVQFVISGGDPATKDNFGVLLKDNLSKRQFTGKVLIDVVDQADHTFTSLSSQPQLYQVIQNFVLKCSSQENSNGQIRNKAISLNHEELNFQTKTTVTSTRVQER